MNGKNMSWIEIGIIVLVVVFIAKMLLGGKGDRNVDFPALIKDGALIIDVRTAGEFSGRHIEGAINIPFDVMGPEIGKHETNKERPIIVYCRSGARSFVAQKELKRNGYTQVVNGGSLHYLRKKLK